MITKRIVHQILWLLFFLYSSLWALICLGLLIMDYLRPIHIAGRSTMFAYVFSYIVPLVPGTIFVIASISIFFERESARKWKNTACVTGLIVSICVAFFYYTQGIHDFLQAGYVFSIPFVIGIAGLSVWRSFPRSEMND
jgi:hypothetical protein